MWDEPDLDLTRRDFAVLMGGASMTGLSGSAMAQIEAEPDQFRQIVHLVGKDSAKPDKNDPFFRNLNYFAYKYTATDTERQFYTDESLNYWLSLPPFSPSIDIHETVVADTATETQVSDYEIPNAQLQQNSLFKYNVLGKYSTASTSDDVTLRLYLDDKLLGSVGSAGKNSTDAPWRASSTITVHKHNGQGHIFAHIESNWDEEPSDDHFDVDAVDLKVTHKLRVSIEWNNAKTDNTLTQDQGYVERWR